MLMLGLRIQNIAGWHSPVAWFASTQRSLHSFMGRETLAWSTWRGVEALPLPGRAVAVWGPPASGSESRTPAQPRRPVLGRAGLCLLYATTVLGVWWKWRELWMARRDELLMGVIMGNHVLTYAFTCVGCWVLGVGGLDEQPCMPCLPSPAYHARIPVRLAACAAWQGAGPLQRGHPPTHSHNRLRSMFVLADRKSSFLIRGITDRHAGAWGCTCLCVSVCVRPCTCACVHACQLCMCIFFGGRSPWGWHEDWFGDQNPSRHMARPPTPRCSSLPEAMCIMFPMPYLRTLEVLITFTAGEAGPGTGWAPLRLTAVARIAELAGMGRRAAAGEAWHSAADPRAHLCTSVAGAHSRLRRRTVLLGAWRAARSCKGAGGGRQFTRVAAPDDASAEGGRRRGAC